jgi:hypothetical protein
MKNIKINNSYTKIKDNDIMEIIKSFNDSDEVIGNQKRNLIKKVSYGNYSLNIKSFKKPNLLNQFVYGYKIRKSKAERSFNYANKLLSLGVGTPAPMAFLEKKSIFGLNNSYYISEHLEYDLTYRELITDQNYPNHEAILRSFVRFTFSLHEKGICFLDHSPGNTLIVSCKEGYKFYLVDLNRMKFQSMNFIDRMKNFSRLTSNDKMIKVMSEEYSKLIELDYSKVYSEMKHQTEVFYKKHELKQKYKKRLFKK